MELALSVGSRSEPSRNRCLFGISDDQIQQRLLLNVREDQEGYGSTNRSPVQLDLKLSWSTEMGNVYDGRSSDHTALNRSDFDVNQVPSSNGGDEGDQEHSSSTSRAITNCQKRSWEMEVEKTSSRCSDEDEGGSTRKKLRLSKEQSAYLEESFKEHTTLNPKQKAALAIALTAATHKQKAALAKQLNLRPRQVEVWFQNRRARTKLKQTEVDLEYLKRCCESLTEENRRLHKELEDLKSLKTHHPLHLHVPATTLTMCPTCERGKGSRIMGGTNFHSHPHHHTSAAT